MHTDHWGDLGSLWADGAGRPVPLALWGPAGATEDMGTAYAVEHFLMVNNWDKRTRESVSFILEFAGFKVVFGGDTSPNQWFIEHATNADFVIHEAFNPPGTFVNFGNQPAQLAWRACCEFHTSGPSFGKVMSTIEPRHSRRLPRLTRQRDRAIQPLL